MQIEPRRADDPVVQRLVIAQQRELTEAEGEGVVVFPPHDRIEFCCEEAL